MAVSALMNNASLFNADTATVSANGTTNTPTETAVAFALPAGTQNPAAVTPDQNEQQTSPENSYHIASEDSSDAASAMTAPTVVTPTLDGDRLSSQQVTPLQLALGQNNAENTAETPDTAQPAEPPTDICLPLADTDTPTDTSTTNADNDATLLLATHADDSHSLPPNSRGGKMNTSSEKNTATTDTENSGTNATRDNSAPSLNISVLTLPAMPSALTTNSTLTTADSHIDDGLLSTGTITPSTNTSVINNTNSNMTNNDSINMANWLSASTTTSALASVTGHANTSALSGKITNDTTSQSLTQMISELSLFAENTSLSTSSTPNLLLFKTSTNSTTQQLGAQLLETLKQQVSTQLSGKTQQTTIRLDPPSLGQLDIAIRIDGDKMTVQINAEHSGVRESLQSSREQLRQLLSTEHSGTVDVDIGQQPSSTPQQRQAAYMQIADTDRIRAAAITSDTTATSASSEPDTAGDWLNTVV